MEIWKKMWVGVFFRTQCSNSAWKFVYVVDNCWFKYLMYFVELNSCQLQPSNFHLLCFDVIGRRSYERMCNMLVMDDKIRRLLNLECVGGYVVLVSPWCMANGHATVVVYTQLPRSVMRHKCVHTCTELIHNIHPKSKSKVGHLYRGSLRSRSLQSRSTILPLFIGPHACCHITAH